MPFFILLVIVLAPFALLFSLVFSLVRIPFAKSRVAKLNEIIAEDWLPRKKYIYIGFNDDLPLTEFIEHGIIPKYGSHIIFDRWSAANNEWTNNEPDTYHRVTAIWQDIASDFDGDPQVIVAILTPEKTEVAEDTLKVYYFDHSKADHALVAGEEVPIKNTEKQILGDINAGLVSWETKK